MNVNKPINIKYIIDIASEELVVTVYNSEEINIYFEVPIAVVLIARVRF